MHPVVTIQLRLVIVNMIATFGHIVSVTAKAAASKSFGTITGNTCWHLSGISTE